MGRGEGLQQSSLPSCDRKKESVPVLDLDGFEGRSLPLTKNPKHLHKATEERGNKNIPPFQKPISWQTMTAGGDIQRESEREREIEREREREGREGESE